MKTHGHRAKRTPTYHSWNAMRQRCSNEKREDYVHYGGRGITVHHSWSSFANFLADMGERPKDTTLDRINVDGNYEPGNCRWATKLEQANNKRNTKKVNDDLSAWDEPNPVTWDETTERDSNG